MLIYHNFLYLFVDLFCFALPFVLSLTKQFKLDLKNFKYFLIGNLVMLSIFIPWDILFTIKNIWWFSSEYTLPFRVFYLPIEEIMFFVFIPFACVFSYFVIKTHSKFHLSKNTVIITYSLLCIITFTIALLNIHKLYTSVTFLLFTIFFATMIIKKEWNFLTIFTLMFLFILPMMILSNGVLTGSFLIEKPIVNYNNEHNLNIRVFNIPIEDFVYGMLMLGINAFVFEKYQQKSNIKETIYEKHFDSWGI